MKEMTIEQKAKAYDNLIERLKKFQSEYRFETIEKCFPELKESEDEGIRKELISLFQDCIDGINHRYTGSDSRRWLAWLEKQGEPAVIIPKFRIGDYVKNVNDKREPIYEIVYMDKECYVCEYRGKEKMRDKAVMHFSFDNPYLRLVQKPADKVEPKFKVGDWAVSIVNGNIYHVINIEGSLYIMEHEDERCTFPWKRTDDILRAWNITDAKDGDVLLSPSTPAGDKECPFIFKEIDENGVVRCHVALLQSENLKIDDGITNVMGYANAGYHIPATKEQRELLFQKMKEAGYEWDAEKKELKKIVAPIFHIGDRVRYKGHACDGIITEITSTDYICGNAKLPISTQDKLELVEQNSALQSQSQWKPSDEQMEGIRCTIKTLKYQLNAGDNRLDSLYNDLKKLREE